MARRRLVMPDAADIERLRAEAAGSARRRLAPPVAQVAGEAADAHGRAFGEAMAQAAALADAEAEGRVLQALPLDVIDDGYLTRDRVDRNEVAMAELKGSLQAHGLRTPIEVVPLADRPGCYGLISGWRRLDALRELARDTEEARFRTVKAIVRPPISSRDAYVAMVEENEVRADLSFYERGRICVVAAELAVFDTMEEAVDALFAASSPAKRSKIRSFARIHTHLGDALRFPTTLGERIGLRIAAALQQGGADRLAVSLREAAPHDAAAEQEVLNAQLDALERDIAVAAETENAPATPPKRRGRPKAARSSTDVVQLARGLTLERRADRSGSVDLRLSGNALTDEIVDAAVMAVQRAIGVHTTDE